MAMCLPMLRCMAGKPTCRNVTPLIAAAQQSPLQKLFEHAQPEQMYCQGVV
jgi:hypothetical protein